MAVIEGKLEKLQEQYVQKEQRIYSLEAINIELKLQLNLKEAKEYTELVTRSLTSKGELKILQVSKFWQIIFPLIDTEASNDRQWFDTEN